MKITFSMKNGNFMLQMHSVSTRWHPHVPTAHFPYILIFLWSRILWESLLSTLQFILLFPAHLHHLISSYITLSPPFIFLSFIFPKDCIKTLLNHFSKLLIKITSKPRNDLSTFSLIIDFFQQSLLSPNQYKSKSFHLFYEWKDNVVSVG